MLRLFDEFSRSPWRDFDRRTWPFGDVLPRTLAAYGDIQTLPVNVYANDQQARIIVSAPGWDADWFDLSVEGSKLRLRGATQPKDGEKGARSINRTIQLPFRVEGDQVNAAYKNGVLTIDLSKAEADRPRKIAISAG